MKYKDFLRLMKRCVKQGRYNPNEWTLEDVLWNWHDRFGFNLFSDDTSSIYKKESKKKSFIKNLFSNIKGKIKI